MLNRDITASPAHAHPISGALSDGTALLALEQQAPAALRGFQSGLMASSTYSWKPYRVDMSTLLGLQRMSSSAVKTLSERFLISATIAKPDEVSLAATTRHGLRAIDAAVQTEGETTARFVVGSEPLADESSSTTAERFQRALAGWKGLLAPDHFDVMSLHVRRLLSDQNELDEDNIRPSLSSFDDMLAFLAGRPWDKAPAVGLNRRGRFSVSWGKSRPQVDVTLSFLGDGLVKWYVYGLGRRRKGSAAGTSDRVDVPAMLSRLGCDEWMAR